MAIFISLFLVVLILYTPFGKIILEEDSIFYFIVLPLWLLAHFISLISFDFSLITLIFYLGGCLM